MRLFVAIDLPEDFKQQIAALQSGIPDARWIPSQNAHVTLSFLGEINEADMVDIGLALSKIKAPSFLLELSGVGVFGNDKRPRILWIGVNGSPELLSLQSKVANTLTRCGVKLEDRRFRPHVTLARVYGSPYEKVRNHLSQHALFKTRCHLVEEFTLFSSHMGHGGSHYEKEISFDLEPIVPAELLPS
ncbi:RNA 2',3'-cyclic phosphodiesterase [Sneathiella limimaris]|uniref:RNA 2',3'-cyclic phosphodiesterase n=1 Tax=Sneathiella limimaris TaxID=1964213 RepID=UPI00146BB5EC|nr:RNA 2',3'-cyclic phosphodiesterase [Sneathiella limimaris]